MWKLRIIGALILFPLLGGFYPKETDNLVGEIQSKRLPAKDQENFPSDFFHDHKNLSVSWKDINSSWKTLHTLLSVF